MIAPAVAHCGFQRRPVQRGAAADICEGFIDAAFHAFQPANIDVRARRGQKLIILLAGGDKSTQPRDIERAKMMARTWTDEG